MDITKGEGVLMKKNVLKKAAVSAAALVFVLVVFSGCAANETVGTQESLVTSVTPDQGIGYTLYYGLVDIDTGKQEKSTDEYRQAIADIFLEAGIGYTVYEAEGAFPREDGTVAENITLVFTGVHGTEEAIQQLIDKTQKELNLESVYCETSLRGYGIYGGVVNTFE